MKSVPADGYDIPVTDPNDLDALGLAMSDLIASERSDDAAWTLLARLCTAPVEDPQAIRALIALLPKQILLRHPGLRALASFVEAAPRAATGARSSTVLAAVDADEASGRDLGWFHMARAMLLRTRSEFAAARDIGAWLRPRLLRTARQHPLLGRDLLSGWFVQLGVTELLGGDTDRAMSDFDEAVSLSAGSPYSALTRDALIHTAVAHALMGRLHRAEAALARAQQLISPQPYPHSDDRELLARTLIAVERMSADAESLLIRSDGRPAGDLWPVHLLARGNWEIARGNPAGALDTAAFAARSRPVPAGSLAAEVIGALRLNAGTMLGLPTPEAVEGVPGPMRRLARARRQLSDPTRTLRVAREVASDDRIGPSLRVEALLLASWSCERLLGTLDENLAASAGALMSAEGLWRPLALFPDRFARFVATPPASVTSIVREPIGPVPLSKRERTVLIRLTQPGSLEQIAQEQHVSVNTIKTQVRSIYRRLDVSSREQAVLVAARQGLLATESPSAG